MEIFFVRYEIITIRGTWPNSISPGHIIEVYLDDATNNFVVYEYSGPSDTTGTLRTSGPDLGNIQQDRRGSPDTVIIGAYGSVQSENPRVPTYLHKITYTFCDSTTLNKFDFQSSFPYVKKTLEPDSTSCYLAVCDLRFTVNTSTPASDTLTQDGSIYVEAESTFGPIKFSLDPNFDYQTQGQNYGSFLGLFVGDYVVTAKDARGCTAQVAVVVAIPDFYNVKYRLEYTDLRGTPTRTDILQRGYTGDIITVTGTAEPVEIDATDTSLNKFTAIIPSSLILGLLSPSNFYFQELFTPDERKHRINHYKDFGNTIPAFTPDVLGSWLQTYYPDTAFIDYKSWSGTSVTLYGNDVSQDRYTIYDFEPGHEYSFDYSFTVASGISGKNLRMLSVKITNEDGSNFGVKLDLSFGSPSTKTGTFTFIAPEGADRIVISVNQFAIPSTYTVDYFDNVTTSSGSQPIGFELKWTGYVINQNYREAYLHPPYPVYITASDGLADLNVFDFVDRNNNEFKNEITVLDVISEILLKTDLGINIQSGVNKFEEQMDTGDGYDPLNQCMIDPTIFSDKNCEFVLNELLKTFGVKIRMRDGKWFIYSPEQSVDEIPFREFNSDGEYLKSGTIDDFIDIKGGAYEMRAAFRDRAQVLEILPAYGKFYLKHELMKNNSLVKSYSFEQDDIETRPDGTNVFKNWNVLITEDPGATFGIKQTKAFEGEYNFFYKKGSNQVGGEKYVTLTSIGGEIEFSSADFFEYKFSYAVILKGGGSYSVGPIWVRIKWMLKFGDYYYSEYLGGWTTDIDYKYNDIYVDKYNGSNDYKVVAQMPLVEELSTEMFDVEFILHRDDSFDFVDDSDLDIMKAIPTVKKPIGYKIKGKISYTSPRGQPEHLYGYYELIDDDSVTDGVQIVRPDDFDEDDNPKVWQIDSKIWFQRQSMRASPNYLKDSPTGENAVEYIYLDNVVLRHLPNGLEPPDDITIESVNNKYIKINFEETYVLNDIETDVINNSERTYRNFLKLLDGSPTQVWERTYRDGTGKLLDLLTSEIKSQYKRGTYKITGSFDVDTDIRPSTVLREINDNNRKYMFMGYRLFDKNCKVQFDIAEIIDVVTDNTSPDIDAGFTTGFSLGYRA